MIAVDIFLDDKVPAIFEQNDFLQNIKKLLKPGGVLLYNRLSFNKKDLSDTKSFFEKQFNFAFPESTFLDVDGNWMLINRSDVLRY